MQLNFNVDSGLTLQVDVLHLEILSKVSGQGETFYFILFRLLQGNKFKFKSSKVISY